MSSSNSEKPVNGTKKLRLTALLKEYESLRTEIRETIRLHNNLHTIVVSAIVAMLGYVFETQTYEIFLVAPIISIALFYRWLSAQESIMSLSFF